jgi:sugar lactone lactonase YvrE
MVASLLTTGTTAALAAVGDVFVGEDNGTIEQFHPDGTASTFASGLGPVTALAFDHSGDLFAASVASGSATIYRFNLDGSRTTFASGFGLPFSDMAFDSADHLFAAGQWTSDYTSHTILKFAQDGSYSIFDSGYLRTFGLQFDSNDNLYIVSNVNPAYQMFKYPPSGSRTTFGRAFAGGSLGIDSSGNIFWSHGQVINKYTPNGTLSQFTTNPDANFWSLAFDAGGTLFATDLANYQVLEISQDGSQTTFASGLSSQPDSIAVLVPEPSSRALLFLVGAAALIRRKTMG